MNTKSVEAKLIARDSGFSNTFKRGQAVLAAFAGEQRRGSSASTGLLGSIKSVAAGMGLYNVVAKSMAQITGSVSDAMERADTLYLFNRNITQVTGSSKVAAEKLKELTAATADTSYKLDTVANATQTFASANIDVGKSIKYSTRMMDLVSRYGDGTNETYKRVMIQMNQMAARGKANLGDIRSATEANIPVWEMMSKQVGKSVLEIQDDVSHGKWTAEDFFDTLIAGSDAASGAAKDGANTWRGSIGIMQSRFVLGYTAILNGFRSMGEAVTGDRFGIFKGITGIGTVVKNMLMTIGKGVEESTPFIKVLGDAWNRVMPEMSKSLKAVTSNLGIFNGSVTKMGALKSFASIVQSVSTHIVNFSRYIRDNAEAIASVANKIPAAVAAIGTLKMITGVTKTFANFGLSVTSNLDRVTDKLGKMNEAVVSNMIEPIKNTLSSGVGAMTSIVGPKLTAFGNLFKTNFSDIRKYADGNIFTTFASSVVSSISAMNPSLLTFKNNIATSMSQLNTLGGNPIGNFFRSLGAAVDLSSGKLATFTRALINPRQSIINLGSAMMANTGKTTFWSAAVTSAGRGVWGGLKAMAAGGISAIRALSAAMLSNPITAALVLITGAVATMAFGWKSNFMNIQGVVKSFGAGITHSMSSVKGMFKGMEPVTNALGSTFKFLGKILTGTLLVAIGAVVDAFRGLVFIGTTVVKSVMAIANGISWLWKKITRDSDGADESFEKMKDNLGSIKDGFNNLADGSNSATGAAIKSLREFGKTSDDVSAKFDKNIQQIMDSTTDLQSTVSEATSKMSLAFDTEDATAGIKKYVQSSNEILTEFYDKRAKQQEHYNEVMQQAEQAEGEEKAALQSKALDVILSRTDASNKSMLALHKELSEQLLTNKNVEGEELTEAQRTAIEEQNDAIRQGLAEQSNLYVRAATARLSEGEKLTAQQQKAAETHLKSLYSTQTEMISSNEAKIKDLQEQANYEKVDSMKEHLLAQVEELKANNESLLTEQKAYGEQELQLLLNGNEATAAATLEGLASRNDITSEQLNSIVQAFMANNTSIDEQMMLLTGLLERNGTEGATKLSEALRSGDLSTLGGELTEEMMTGMASLPESLFHNGNEGKDKFIAAIKSGDVAGAAQYLSSGITTNVAPIVDQLGNTGKEAGNSQAKGLQGTSGANANASKSVGQKALEEAISQSKKFRDPGKSAGETQARGLEGTSNTNARAGTFISNAAYTSVNAGVDRFNPLGYNMGKGVANGLEQALPDVQRASDKIVEAAEKAVAAKAKIKSPARVFIPLGRFMGLGISKGWDKSTKDVISSVGNVVEAARAKANNLAQRAFQIEPAFEGASDIGKYNSTKDSGTSKLMDKLDTITNLLSQRQTVEITKSRLVDTVDTGTGEVARRERRRLLK